MTWTTLRIKYGHFSTSPKNTRLSKPSIRLRLNETEEGTRKIFVGSAGTGKTYIAIEKARRSATRGKRVFLTCYNKHLVCVFEENIRSPLVIGMSFHDYLRNNGYRAGELYIFADPNQNLFGNDAEFIRKYDISKHRLTLNLRNSDKINEWTKPLVSGKWTRSKLRMPVVTIQWKDAVEEKKLLEKEIGRLVSQGLSPARFTILSPHRKEKNCLRDVERIKEWPLTDFTDGRQATSLLRSVHIRARSRTSSLSLE